MIYDGDNNFGRLIGGRILREKDGEELKSVLAFSDAEGDAWVDHCPGHIEVDLTTGEVKRTRILCSRISIDRANKTVWYVEL